MIASFRVGATVRVVTARLGSGRSNALAILRLCQAIAAVDEGKFAVVDVRVEPGYDVVVRKPIVETPAAARQTD